CHFFTPLKGIPTFRVKCIILLPKHYCQVLRGVKTAAWWGGRLLGAEVQYQRERRAMPSRYPCVTDCEVVRSRSSLISLAATSADTGSPSGDAAQASRNPRIVSRAKSAQTSM